MWLTIAIIEFIILVSGTMLVVMANGKKAEAMTERAAAVDDLAKAVGGKLGKVDDSHTAIDDLAEMLKDATNTGGFAGPPQPQEPKKYRVVHTLKATQCGVDVSHLFEPEGNGKFKYLPDTVESPYFGCAIHLELTPHVAPVLTSEVPWNEGPADPVGDIERLEALRTGAPSPPFNKDGSISADLAPSWFTSGRKP